MSKNKAAGKRKGKGNPKRNSKAKGNGMRAGNSGRFIPPSSGQALRMLMDAFKLRQTDRLKSSAAREYFSGKRVKPDTVNAVVSDLAEAFFAAGITPPGASLSPKTLLDGVETTEEQQREVLVGLVSLLRGCAELWDQLIDEFKHDAPHVPSGPQLGLAFARLIVIDVALRIAAFRSYHQLGPLEPPVEDGHAGFLIRRLLEVARLTRTTFSQLARVSEKTVDDWCDEGTRMSEENILDAANALSSDPVSLASSLRRHYAWWALRAQAAAAFGEHAAADLFSSLVRLANRIFHGLSRTQLLQMERRMEEVRIIFVGRSLESTVFWREYAAEKEQDGHWVEALTVNDVDYVIGHARRLAAIPEVRARFEARGVDMALIDRIAQVASNTPRLGFVPQKEIAGQHMYRIRGDAEFTAYVRDAQAEEALLRGDLDGAVVHLRRQVSLQPENAMWHFKLGAVLAQRGDYEEALAECWLAAKIEPTWELPRVEIGVIHLDAGHAEKAVEELEVARTSFEAPSAHLLHHLGVGYFRLGKLLEADEALKAALSIECEDAMTLEVAAEVAYRLEDTARGWKLAKEAAHRGRPGPLQRWHRPKGK